MYDCLLIGGGVIGLSLAWELAQAGLQVRVIDQGQPGQEASWAGAGMLPPGAQIAGASPLEQLAALSSALHPVWAERLMALTGIDTGFRRCGAVYVAREASLRTALHDQIANWRAGGIQVDDLDADALQQVEPGLRSLKTFGKGEGPRAYFVPAESQLRNPRHVQALLSACRAAGVEISPGVAADDFRTQGGKIVSVETNVGAIPAGQVCITAGCWSGRLARRLGISAAIRPVRGQIVLFRDDRRTLTRIVNEGPRYLVPRGDGLILAGATEEEAGYDRSTTAGGVAGLIEFALSLVPELESAAIERSWAGLRPATLDGQPFLGRAGQWENATMAAGHFRAGIYLSPATAVVMRRMILGESPQMDLAALRVDRT